MEQNGMKELGEQGAEVEKGLNEKEKGVKKTKIKNRPVGLIVDVKREGQRSW